MKSKKTKIDQRFAFEKATVTELNSNQMIEINGGSSPVCYPLSIYTIIIISK